MDRYHVYEATIASLERAGNAQDGSPRYIVHFEGGNQALTEPSAVPRITNPEYHQGFPVRIKVLTRTGAIVDVATRGRKFPSGEPD